ncbi:MAG: TetR/AcrR family transcriptional regulator [Eubacterium sp.]|nr:TetR/AcrR family transcriptional regulator [Eubacterium sp.]
MRRKDDEKQRRIKAAVMNLILSEGLTGTSIAKIARAASVSPATVYIYYDSKEAMLRDMYQEYSEDVFDYMIANTLPGCGTRYLIESLIRSYYRYIRDNREIFSFVEQFSQCPALAAHCAGKREICRLYDMIDERKKRGEIRPFSDEALAAVMFHPVKAIATDTHLTDAQKEERLCEVIEMVQRALIINY